MSVRPFLLAAAFLVGVAFLATLTGCNNGSEIPIDPTCVDQVTDECVPEVIAEFCDVCETCPPPVVCPPPTPPQCFVAETEKVCVQRRHGRCCKWEKVVTYRPIDCTDLEIEVR